MTRLCQGYGEPRGVLRAGPTPLPSLCRYRTWPLPTAPRPSHLSRSASREPQIQGSSSVQSLSRVPLFPTPWTAAHQASLSFTNSQSLLKLMSIKSVMPSNHLTLCHPFLFPLSNFPSIRVFSSESALCIRWPKYWSFSFSLSPSSEYSGLISFRMDWLDLLSVQGTLQESSPTLQFKSMNKPGVSRAALLPEALGPLCLPAGVCVSALASLGLWTHHPSLHLQGHVRSSSYVSSPRLPAPHPSLFLQGLRSCWVRAHPSPARRHLSYTCNNLISKQGHVHRYGV